MTIREYFGGKKNAIVIGVIDRWTIGQSGFLSSFSFFSIYFFRFIWFSFSEFSTKFSSLYLSQ